MKRSWRNKYRRSTQGEYFLKVKQFIKNIQGLLFAAKKKTEYMYYTQSISRTEVLSWFKVEKYTRSSSSTSFYNSFSVYILSSIFVVVAKFKNKNTIFFFFFMLYLARMSEREILKFSGVVWRLKINKIMYVIKLQTRGNTNYSWVIYINNNNNNKCDALLQSFGVKPIKFFLWDKLCFNLEIQY